MDAVYVVNDHESVRKALSHSPQGPFKYLVFQEHLYGEESHNLSAAGGEKIDVASLFAEVNRGFGLDFVAWMGDLNNAQDSDFWRQLNLAGKSALSTRVCERAFYSACLSRVLGTFREDVIVVYDDSTVVRQLEQNEKGRRIHDFRSPRPLYRIVLTERLPGKIIHRLGVVLWRKLLSGPTRIRGRFQRAVVVKTVVSEGSFDQEGAYCDLYFRELLDFLRNNARSVLVVGVVLSAYGKLLGWSRKAGAKAVYSLEQALGFLDVLACFARAFRMFYSRGKWMRPTPPFRGVQLGRVVRDSVMEELRSGQYVANLMNARATERIVKRHDVERFILPFENRGWERADILTIRRHSGATRIIGYQHAAITRKHTEYFRAETENMPMPDAVISMGEVTARILVDMGKYPAGAVKAGCALRQKEACSLGPRRLTSGNVLVLFSTSTDYYRRTVARLNDIFGAAEGYSICIRAHPLIPLNKSVRSTMMFPYSEDKSLSHEKAIDWADVAIYSSSTTLAFNCLQRGKPVIYMPVDDYLDADPLFELSEVKWVVRTADDFKKAMQDIRSMADDEWRARSSRAQDYVRRYFGPVTERSMRLFLE